MTHSHVIAVGFILAGIVVACDALTTPLEPDQDTISPKDVIALTRARAGPLLADGLATDTLFARIPRKAANRLVTFTTTIGRFVETETAKVTVRAVIQPEGELLARTVIRTEAAAGTAFVRATVGDFYDTLTIRFIHP